MFIHHNTVGAARKRTRLVLSILASAILTSAGLFGLSGSAQAALPVTVKLTAQGVCDSGPDYATPYTTLATANINHYYKLRISGRLTGLTAGHSYAIASNQNTRTNGVADIGHADKNGDVTVANALYDGGTYGYTATAANVSVYDLANGIPGDGKPTANTTMTIADNCSRLIAGSSHDRLIQGALRLIQQGDGNLVLYQGGKALWSSRTDGNPGAQTVLQGDGNLVVYSRTGTALWSSRTNQPANAPYAYDFRAELVLQGDKNLVLYELGPVAEVRWATYTN